MAVERRRPVRPLEVLWNALDIWRDHFPALILAAAFVVVPARLALSLVLALPNNRSPWLLAAYKGILSGPLSLAVGVLGSAACMHAISEAFRGRPTHWRASVGYMLRRLGSVLWVAGVYAVGVTIGFLLLVVPGVILIVLWSLAVPILLLEQVRGREALARSRTMVARDWLWVGAALACGWLVAAIVKGVIALVAFLLSLGAPSGYVARYFRIFFTDTLGDAVTTPIIAVLLVLMYFELRASQDGVEPEQVAMAIGSSPDDPSDRDLFSAPVHHLTRLMRRMTSRHAHLARRMTSRHNGGRRAKGATKGGSKDQPLDDLARTGAPVAIVFTDMEGSTEFTRRLGDASAREILREHDRILRACLDGHAGREVKHLGDGIMACFPSASRAVGCAMEMERTLDQRNEDQPDVPIRIRIGINAGEPLVEDGDLFGVAVQTAARIMAEARPGQILVSEVVRQLAVGRGYSFVHRGPVLLKGFEEPFPLYEVEWREASAASDDVPHTDDR